MRRAMLVLVLATLASTPAAAQLARHGPPTPTPRKPLPTVDRGQRLPDLEPWRDVADVRRQIEHGRDEGSLTKKEGRRYRREANQIGTLADRYGDDGLSDSEAAELRVRSGVLREQVNLDRLRRPRP